VTTRHGAAILRVLVSRSQQPGTLFVPIHWSAENSSAGRVGALVQPATDPFSGQPEAKATPARIAAHAVSNFGFLLSRQRLQPPGLAYWAHTRATFGHVLNFALDAPRGGWAHWLRALLPAGDHLIFQDPAAGVHRAAVLREGRLEAVVFVGAAPKLPSPDWLKSCFALAAIAPAERRALLAGTPVEGVTDDGPVVCVCFQVGAKRIEAAAAAGNRSVEKIGCHLGAGTNCGSCIPEIRRLIAPRHVSETLAPER
jgi:assimilatory nitrate reductase catalytic subunit